MGRVTSMQRMFRPGDGGAAFNYKALDRHGHGSNLCRLTLWPNGYGPVLQFSRKGLLGFDSLAVVIEQTLSHSLTHDPIIGSAR